MSRGRALLCLLVATAVAVGCGRSVGSRGFILISIDTLRADHLGAYGYDRATSPFLDRLAARGVVFERAFAPLPGTLPSHMSMFTGLYPEEHGVFPPAGVLPLAIETLPEIFQKNGFATGGRTEGGYVHGGYGFARGFDRFDDSAWKIESDVERTFQWGLDFIRRLGPEDRFFLFLHTYTVHDPYFPPEPWRTQFWPGEPPDTFEPTGPNLVAVNRGRREVTPAEVEYFEALYDASIRYMDSVLAGFFQRLERIGVGEEITVVLTADHGEEFLEHGRLVHEQLYPECLHVPLIVVEPGVRPRRVRQVVANLDVFPTLLSLAGLPVPEGRSGRDLSELLRGDPREPWDDTVFATEVNRRHRSVFSAEPGGPLLELVERRLGSGEAEVWMQRRQRFYLEERPTTFQATSYHQPRTLTARAESSGEVLGRWSLSPDSWTEIAVEPGSASTRNVVLEASGCVSPAQVGEGADRRCLSARLRGLDPRHVELYDLSVDPLATADRSELDPGALRRLWRRLDAFQPVPLAQAEERELDPELKQHLEALGYLQ